MLVNVQDVTRFACMPYFDHPCIITPLDFNQKKTFEKATHLLAKKWAGGHETKTKTKKENTCEAPQLLFKFILGNQYFFPHTSIRRTIDDKFPSSGAYSEWA